jgi:hypothetical protein
MPREDMVAGIMEVGVIMVDMDITAADITAAVGTMAVGIAMEGLGITVAGTTVGELANSAGVTGTPWAFIVPVITHMVLRVHAESVTWAGQTIPSAKTTLSIPNPQARRIGEQQPTPLTGTFPSTPAP